MQDKLLTFDDAPPQNAKDVSSTKQLEPRTGAEPFLTESNEEKRYTTKTKGLGKLGNKGFASNSGGD